MNGKKRAKATLPAIKELITKRAIGEPQKNREDLADEIIEEIKEEYPKEVPPAWETVIKLISAARNHERYPIDNPWYIHTLKDYPISAEAIGHIIEVQKVQPEYSGLPVIENGFTRQPLLDGRKDEKILIVENGKQYIGLPLKNKEVPQPNERIIFDPKGRRYRAIGVSIKMPVSIRQALWISKLYAISSLRKPVTLTDASLVYSLAEILSDIAKTDFNSSELDAILRQDKPDEALKKYLQRYTKDELQGLYKYMAGFPLKERTVKNERMHNKKK